MNPAFSEFVTTAHSPATDPHLHVWGWEIPVYLFLGGFTAAIMVLSGWAPVARPAQPPLAPDVRPRLERPVHAGPRHDLARHAGPLPRPRSQAVRLPPVPDHEAVVPHVLGLLDPAPRLPRSGRRRAPRTAGPAGPAAPGDRPRVETPRRRRAGAARARLRLDGAPGSGSASTRASCSRPSARGHSGRAACSARSSWPRASRRAPPSRTGPRPSRRSGGRWPGSTTCSS